MQSCDKKFCSAYLPLTLTLSLSLHTYVPFATSHKLRISALSSICVGDGSPVSCTSAPALDRVSASVLKLFFIVPQGICLTLSGCQHDEGLPAVPYRAGQKAQDPTKGMAIRLSSPLMVQCSAASAYTSLQNVVLSWVSVFQESRKRVKLEKKEPLVESQLFIMELARELNKICQVNSALSFSFCLSQTNMHLCYIHIYIIHIFYSRGQASLATSGPAKTSGRQVCVGISLWNGLLCWRSEYRYVRSEVINNVTFCLDVVLLLQLLIIYIIDAACLVIK